MNNKKILILVLLLLLLGSVFTCGCEWDGPMPIVCSYDAAKDRWDCFYWIIFTYTDPKTNEEIIMHKTEHYTTKYCNPYSDSNQLFKIYCNGKEYAPPSPSPSPSPSPTPSGPTYKISEMGINNGGGGGGGGGPSPTS